jgi:hypothetical protein
VAEPAHGRERAAHVVIDEVEAATAGQARHERLYRLRAIDEECNSIYVKVLAIAFR